MRIEEILFWLFLGVALLLLILKLKGSPTSESILAALIGALGLFWKEFSDFKGEVMEFMGQTKEFIGQVKKKLKIK
jgi:hypothetical protein